MCGVTLINWFVKRNCVSRVLQSLECDSPAQENKLKVIRANQLHHSSHLSSVMRSCRFPVKNARLTQGWMCFASEETRVQLETCGQLANVTAADATASLDSCLQPAGGSLSCWGGIQIAEISPGSLPAPHKAQWGQLFSFRDREAGQEISVLFLSSICANYVRGEWWRDKGRGCESLLKNVMKKANTDTFLRSVITMVMDEWIPGGEQSKWKQGRTEIKGL